MEKTWRSVATLYRLPRISNLNLRLTRTSPSTSAAAYCCYVQCKPFSYGNNYNHDYNIKSIHHTSIRHYKPEKPPDVTGAKRILTSTAVPTVTMKWEDASDLVPIVEPISALTSAIIPFAQQNIFQWIVFPYTFATMYYLDFLTGYMPWWLAIVGTTATIRLAFFPLVLKQNVMGIKLYNLLPESQKIQVQINEAMCTGDNYKTAINRTKLKLFYQENNVSLKDRLWPIFVQAPAFMSLFFLLRRLATEPLEALYTGGTLWFTNLTIPDPLFILPVMTCTSIFLLMTYGLEGTQGPLNTMGPMGRWIVRLLPLGMFAFVYNFPAAVLLFWTTNNFFTLCFALMFKHPAVKKKFNIPDRLNHDPASLPLTNQSFQSQIKTAIDQGRSKRTTIDVRRLDDIAFRRAGVGPLRKTYKTMPTQEEIKN